MIINFKKFFLSNLKIFFIFIISFLFFYSAISFYLQSFLTADVLYPDYTSFVNDYTGVVSADWKNKIENLCKDVKNKTGAEIAVAVINSLEGLTIEEYAVKLFEKWKIGKADKDNGVLLLIAIKDRRLRIEVGYGLEGAITDLEAGDIVNDVISPFFKKENYGEGIYNGVAAIAHEIYKEYGIESSIEATQLSTKKSAIGFFNSILDSFGDGSGYCFFCCVPIFLFGLILSIIKSILRRKCPRCKKLTLKIKQIIIQEPTYNTNGKMLETRTCSNCGYSDKRIITLPKKSRSSSGGGFFTGGGSFSSGSGGGGFGGFGGGSSGGGGASGGW